MRLAFQAGVATDPASAQRWERAFYRLVELLAEALREGGLLVTVFGLLDYYLGEGHPGVGWPLWSAGLGVTLLTGGITMEIARQAWSDISKR